MPSVHHFDYVTFQLVQEPLDKVPSVAAYCTLVVTPSITTAQEH